MKFGKNYIMSITGIDGNKYAPAFPTTIELDVQRNTFSSANYARFTLYNLSAAARRNIYMDRYVGVKKFLPITIHAGYGLQPNLSLIFTGSIFYAWSERRGPQQWVTHIEAFDGGYAQYNTQASGLFIPAGSSLKQAASILVQPMNQYGVKLGAVSSVQLNNSTPIPCADTNWNMLRKITPGDAQFFVDQGVANILNPQDYLPNPPIINLSAANGLLNTPRQSGNLRTLTTVFEPSLQVGQLVSITSLETWLSGPQFKVVGVHHYGQISGVDSQPLYTDVSVLAGYSFNPLAAAGSVAEAMVP